MTHKSARDLRADEEIRQWQARLNREWPERQQVAQQMAKHVAELSVVRPLVVVELAVGAGYLAEVLLPVLPDVRYIGFERSEVLLDYARRRLLSGSPDDSKTLDLRQADLNEQGWLRWLAEAGLVGKIDAVVSLQSVHDLGGEAEQAQLYRVVGQLLKPQGRFINADLLLKPQKPHPRRLPAARHLALLRDAGFAKVNLTLEMGELACFVADMR